MADPSQYLVHPETGEVVTVLPDKVATAKQRGFTPANEQQIKQYDAEVAASQDVLGAPKAFASSLGRGLIGAVTDIPYVATSVVPSVTEISEKLYDLPGLRGLISEDARAELKSAAAQDKAIRQRMAGAAREVTAEKLEQRFLGVTPEEQKAQEEVFPSATLGGTVASFLTPMALEKAVEKGGAALAARSAKAAEQLAAAESERAAASAAHQVAVDKFGKVLSESSGVSDADQFYKMALENRAALPANAAPEAVASADSSVAYWANQYNRAVEKFEQQSAIARGELAETAQMQLAPEVKAAADAAQKAASKLGSANVKEFEAAMRADQAGRPSVMLKAAKLAQKYGVSTPGLLSKAGEATTALAEKATVPMAGVVRGPIGLVTQPLSERMAQSGLQSLVDAAPTVSNLPKITQEVVGKAAARGLGTTLELALFNVGQGVHEDILGDHELTAERALAHAEHGALGNFALGAGLSLAPPALMASLSGLGLATRTVRDASLKAFPSIWQRLSGVSENEANLLIANREALRSGEITVSDLIKQDLQRTAPLTEPVAPIAPAPLVQKGEISEKAARFTEALRDQHDLVNRVRNEFKKTIMPEETAKAIEAHVEAQKLAAREAFNETWGGKAKTPNYWRGVKAAEEQVMQPYREIGTNFAKDVFRVINGYLKQPELNLPQNTFFELGEIAQKAMNLAETAKTAGQIQRGMADLKFQIYDLIPRQRSLLQSLSTDRRIAARAAKEVYGLAKDLTVNADLWGDAAAKIAKADEVAKVLYSAEKDVFGKGGLGETFQGQPRFSKESMSKLVRNSATEEAADKLERLTNYQNAVRDYDAMVKEYAAQSQQASGLPELGAAIGKADRMYSAAQAKVAQSIEDAAAAKKYGVDVKAYKNDAKAYRQQLKDRAQFAGERAKVLGDVASTAKSVDAVAATGFALGVLTKVPALEGAAALLKTGQIVVNPTQAIKTLAWLEKGAKATENLSRNVANRLVKGESLARDVIGVTRNVGSMKQERDEYERRVARLNTFTSDIPALDAHLDSAVNDIIPAAPKIAEQVRTKQAQAIGVLSNAVPQPPLGLAPFQRKNWQPTDQQVRDFNRTYDAVAYPKSVLAKIADGTATADEMHVVKTIYPTLIQDTRAKILEMLNENPNIPAARRQMLSRMLNLDVDGSSRLGLTAQTTYQQTQTPPDARQQMPVSRAKGLDLSGRAGAETKAWMDAQRGIGAWNKTNK